MLALAFGVIYLLVGIVGFFITGFGDFFGNGAEPGVHHADDKLLVLHDQPDAQRRRTS